MPEVPNALAPPARPALSFDQALGAAYDTWLSRQSAAAQSDEDRARVEQYRLGGKPAFLSALAQQARTSGDEELYHFFDSKAKEAGQRSGEAQQYALDQEAEAGGGDLSNQALRITSALRAGASYFPGYSAFEALVNKGAQAVGLAPKDVSVDAGAALGERQLEGSTLGEIGLGAAKAGGALATFTAGGGVTGAAGAGLRGAAAVGKAGKAADIAGRVLAGRLGNFVTTGAALRLGRAGSEALATAIDGGSPYRQQAQQILSEIPAGAVQDAFMAGASKFFDAAGKAFAFKMGSQWGPKNANVAGAAISDLGLKTGLSQRAANALGGGVEWLGFAGLPNIMDGGRSSFVDMFSDNEQTRHKALIDIASQLIVGIGAGALHPNAPLSPWQREQQPSSGFFMQPAAKLSPGVEQAVRSSMRDALDTVLAQKGGEEQLIADFVNVLRAREAYGLEKPGTVESLIQEVGAHHIRQIEAEQQQQQEQAAQQEKERLAKRTPKELGFLEPGEEYADAESLQMAGELPFTASMVGTKLPEPGVPQSIAEPGAKVRIKINVGGEERWQEATVRGPVREGAEGEQGQTPLKGLVAETPDGRAVFISPDHVKAGLVKPAEKPGLRFGESAPPTGEAKPVERKSDERQLPLKRLPESQRLLTETPEQAAARSKESAAKAGEKAAQSTIDKLNESMVKQRAQRNTAERKRTAEKLLAQRGELRKAKDEATTDSLTGLKNRSAFDAAQKTLPSRKGHGVMRIDMTNMKAANEPGHENGDATLRAAAVKLAKAAQEAGLEARDVFRVGGDEFAVVGDKKMLRKMSAALDAADNKIGETKIGDKNFEHRLIAGEPKDTDTEADKSQKRLHDTYKKQAEAAGLGVYREATAATKAPETKGAATPESGSPKAEQQPQAPTPAATEPGPTPAPPRKPSPREEKRAARAAEDDALAKGLEGSGFPPERVEQARTGGWLKALGDPAARGKVYRKGSWRLVTKQDVMQARADVAASPDDAEAAKRLAYVERAAQVRGLDLTGSGSEPEESRGSLPPTTTPTAAAASPSVAPTFSEGQKQEMNRTMQLVREAGVKVETIDDAIKALDNQISAASNAAAGNEEGAAEHLADLEARKAVLTAVREARVEEESSLRQQAQEPPVERPEPEVLTERAMRKARSAYEVRRAELQAIEKTTGKKPTATEKRELRSMKKQVDDLTAIDQFVRQKKYGLTEKPSEVVSFFVPKPGDYLTIRSTDGKVVTGVVAASKAINPRKVRTGEERGPGARIKIITEDGIKTVRLSDVNEVSPGDAMNTDWSRGVELTRRNFVRLFAGQADSSRSLASLRERAQTGTKTAEGTIQEDQRNRSALLRGEGTKDDAKRAAANRADRIRKGRADSEDWTLEANAFLAPDDQRYEVPFELQQKRASIGRQRSSEKQSSRDAAEDVFRDEIGNVAIVNYYDPKAKLRDPEELKKAAETDADAHRDYYSWLSYAQRAEAARAAEEDRLASTLAAKRAGQGFALVDGDPEHDQTVWVMQRTLSPSGKWGRQNPLIARLNENGNVTVRDATPDEIAEKIKTSPKMREVMDGITAERHAEREGRLTDEAHQNYISRSVAVLQQVRKEIGRLLLYDEGDQKGPLFDAAREWLKTHPRPEDGTREFKAWTDALKEFVVGTPPKKGEVARGGFVSKGEAKGEIEGVAKEAGGQPEQPGIGGLAMRMIEQHLDLRSGAPLTIDPKSGEVRYAETAGTTLRGIVPGYIPLPMLKGTVRAALWPVRTASKLTAQITRGLLDTFVFDPVKNVLFTPDKIGWTPDWVKSSSTWKKYESWSRGLQSAFGETDNASRVRTIMNRHEGRIEEYEQRKAAILHKLTGIPRDEALKMVSEHHDGTATDPRLEPFRDFMREMWTEMKRRGVVPPGTDSRWEDHYVHLGRWIWTKEMIDKKIAELTDQRKAARAVGKDTDEIDEALERVEAARDQHGDIIGPGKPLVLPWHANRITDAATRALVRQGFLRWKAHDKFAEAVKDGLDASDPIALLADSMDEFRSVAMHQLFDEIAADSTLAPKVNKAPSWYKPITPAFEPRNSAWRKLDGRAVEPFLYDLLTMRSPGYGPGARIVTGMNAALKVSYTASNPANVMTNYIGNPLMMAAKGMPLADAYINYNRALAELLMSEPWMPESLRQRMTSTKTKFGKNRDVYMREGWLYRPNDLTRELKHLFDRDSRVREFMKKGYEWSPERDQSVMNTLLAAAHNLADRGVNVYSMLDGAARAALYEHLRSTGSSHDEAANTVNDAFDVTHLPRFWNRARQFAALGGPVPSFLSWGYATARNLRDVVSHHTPTMAGLALVALMVRKAVAAKTGKTDEEIDNLIDASIPHTGNRVHDYMNRLTAIPIPTQDGVKVYSMFKYMPGDAMLNIAPGARQAYMGGYDERGRTIPHGIASYAMQNLMSGPFIEWYMDRDALSFKPVQDRYDQNLMKYMIERQGGSALTAALSAVPGESALAELLRVSAPFVGSAYRKAVGRPGIRVEPEVPSFAEGAESPFPGATARRYDPGKDVLRWLGGEGLTPNVAERMREEIATRGASTRLTGSDTKIVPVSQPGEPGRREGKIEAAQADALGSFQKGLRLWAMVQTLAEAEGGKGDYTPGEVLDELHKMTPTRQSVFDAARTLIRLGHPEKGTYILDTLWALNAMPPPDARIPKVVGGTIPAR